MLHWIYLLSLIVILEFVNAGYNFKNFNLPESHMPYHLNKFPELKEACFKDENCPYRESLEKNVCWGYEPGCDFTNSFSSMECPNDAQWLSSKQEQIDLFYKQGDFGYIREQIKELKTVCKSRNEEDSFLKCSEHLRFCQGRNIMVNFTNVAQRTEAVRYAMDILSDGDVGGYCRLKSEKLKKESDFLSPLQSWGPELRFFRELDKPVDQFCDINIEIPTIFMKIDATNNMYHHFCDFFNLYATQHVNLTHPYGFSKDVRILIWESYQYFSYFAPAYFAFTQHPLWNLNTFKGKVVCFKNLILPLLPRTIFGLYYNTPIVTGCEKSGLFRAFREHILHRLSVPAIKRTDKIKITFLSRNTAYRNVLNENELIEALNENPEYIVKKVVFNKEVMFKKQLKISRNTDIFIGLHGAGLTHLLFLPDWAAVFELYNCGDGNCYKDLARLRGIKYITWEKQGLLYPQDEGRHPESGVAHEKFTNFSFDKDEFLRLVKIAATHVYENKFKYHQEEPDESSHDEL